MLRLVGAFVQTDEEMQQIHDMETMAASISEDSAAAAAVKSAEDTTDERAG